MIQKTKQLIMTLVALITVSTGAWADNLNKVKYALTAGLTISAGTTVDVKDDDGNVVATITYSETGGADFTTKATSSTSALDGYTAFTEGNGTNGEQTGGTFYTIVPVCDGTIDVAVVLNADKQFYILEDGTALEGYNGKTVDSKYYGTFTFNVKADKTYKIYAYNSKLGIYGFEFTYEPITWVYPTANTNEWTFQMSDNDVIVAVNYYPGRLTFGAATEGGTVEIEGMSDNKMPKGFEKSEKGNIYVEEGTTFIVKAVPAEGFHLVSWSDDAENTSLVRTITMGEENLELSATFSNTFDVTLNTEKLSNEEAALWKGAAGDNAPTPFTLTGVKVGTPVKAIYSGQRRVKSVNAVMKSPAAAPGPSLADAFTDGAEVIVTVNTDNGKWMGVTGTYSTTSGTYTTTKSGSTIEPSNVSMTKDGNNLLVKLESYNTYEATFNLTNNTYYENTTTSDTPWDMTDLKSITINGVDYTSQLTKLPSETINFDSGLSGTYFSVSNGAYNKEESPTVFINQWFNMTISGSKTITKVVLVDRSGDVSNVTVSSGTFDGDCQINDVNATSVTISNGSNQTVTCTGVKIYYE